MWGGEKELFQIGLLLTKCNREGITAFNERAGKLLIETAPSVGEMHVPRDDWQHLCHGDVKSKLKAEVSATLFSEIKWKLCF